MRMAVEGASAWRFMATSSSTQYTSTGIIGCTLGLNRDSGKENGNHYHGSRCFFYVELFAVRLLTRSLTDCEPPSSVLFCGAGHSWLELRLASRVPLCLACAVLLSCPCWKMETLASVRVTVMR